MQISRVIYFKELAYSLVGCSWASLKFLRLKNFERELTLWSTPRIFSCAGKP